MLKIGDRLPDVKLQEYVEVATEACAIGPNAVNVLEASKAKRIVLFGLPGAFTPTCSQKQVPGYVENYDALLAAGVDEIWCVSVNDAFVMGAWGREQQTAGKVRMLADGSAEFAKANGLTLDLSKGGLGLRSQRYAMFVVDGVVKSLAVETNPGALTVSSAEEMLNTVKNA